MDAFLPRVSEWSAAATMFAIGMMLKSKMGLMTTEFEGYRFLLQLFSQDTWAMLFLVGGTVRLIILGINGSWSRSPHARWIAAFLSCFLWSQVCMSFGPTGRVAGFGFIFALNMWIMDFVNVIRAVRDARYVDDELAKGAADGGSTQP